jgi:hypothetical protein
MQGLQWLLRNDEPWTRYRTLVDLLDRPTDDPQVQDARSEMIAHPQIQSMIEGTADWPGYPLKRHNDAAHMIYKFSTLADFGIRVSDSNMAKGIEAVLSHHSPEGPFQIVVNIPKAFGGTGEDMWTWILCDSPTLLYSLLAMGLGEDSRVRRAVDHLVGLVDENGWRCRAASELGKFKGPGRREDPCPIVNVYALKALSLCPDLIDSPPTHLGTEMLLGHWERRGERKMYLFGIGTDFRKLKYPYVWYDVLHVVDVLSRYPFVHSDPRFLEMVEAITVQADGDGCYTAKSMYRAWKDWSFADKKNPSPWLTFLVLRILKRIGKQDFSHAVL